MINVILVEPEGDENIGAVTRAMKNMDVKNIILVNPKCNHLSKESYKYSVHAKDILENAVIKAHLDDALNGMALSIAMSRRTGQLRKRDYWVDEMAQHIDGYSDKDVALVFGREKSGLTNEEVRLCDLTCSIPVSESFPSLNLSQAVMVTLYEIFKLQQKKNDKKVVPLASRYEFDLMMEQIIGALRELGFFKSASESRLKSYINQLLSRAKLDSRDSTAIKNMFRRVEGITLRLKKNIRK